MKILFKENNQHNIGQKNGEAIILLLPHFISDLKNFISY